MSVLSSFINYGKVKKGKFKASAKTPFSRRPDLTPSNPYVTTFDVIDIHDKTTTTTTTTTFHPSDAEPASASEVGAGTGNEERRQQYDLLKVNINPEPLRSYFPPEFLKSDSVLLHLDEETALALGGGTSANYGVDGREGSHHSTKEDDKDSEYVMGYNEDSEPTDELIAKLQHMDASSFVGIRPPTRPPPTRPPPPAPSKHGSNQWKKSVPAPLKIPNASEAMNSKVHILRSSDSVAADGQNSQSQISTPASSAISGTTLARALFNNTFVLSVDSRDSRKHRSGASTLTRSDSATLPFGEHPFLNSPFMRERKSSGSADVLSWSSSANVVPPVPPLPPDAERLFMATKSGSIERSITRNPNRRSSSGSYESSVSFDFASRVGLSEVPVTAVMDSVAAGTLHFSRRISRISEATNSLPATPLPSATKEDEDAAEDGSNTNPEPPWPPPPPPEDETREVENKEEPQQPVSPPARIDLPRPTSVSSCEISPKDLDNVIDYYSGSSPNASAKGFVPAFSPITEVSETPSQFPTPATSSKKRRSSVMMPFTPSPLTSPGRDFATSHKRRTGNDGNRSARLPIGERSRSSHQFSPSAGSSFRSHRNSSSISSMSTEGTHASEVFRRKRSGSAPSPIIVVRDSKDLNRYKITVSPSSNDISTPPTTASEHGTQTFPETPRSGWSPPPGSSTSVAHRLLARDANLSPFPHTPLSALLQPSIAQTLVTRAGTTVRHSRQTNLIRNRGRAGSQAGAKAEQEHVEEKAHIPLIGEEEEATKGAGSGRSGQAIQQVEVTQGEQANSVSDGGRQLPSLPVNASLEPLETDGISSLSILNRSDSSGDRDSLPKSIHESRQPNGAADTSHTEQRHRAVRKPTSNASSITFVGVSTDRINDPETSVLFSGANRDHPVERAQPKEALSFPFNPANSVQSSHSPIASRRIPSKRLSIRLNPENSHSPSSPAHRHAINIHSATPAVHTHGNESPPPYDTLFNDRSTHDNRTPSTGNSGFDSFHQNIAYTSHAPPTTSSHESLVQGSSSNRRPRARPRLPAGPRERRDGRAGHSARDRNGSVSSIGSNAPSLLARSGVSSMVPLPSPKFHVPSPKWKGLTMEAAKWTFTSAELQAIVSRAIKQSAEALSIRLLHLETLDNDIPEDLRMLEAEKREVLSRYKGLARQRQKLLDSLSQLAAGSQGHESPGAVLRVVESLKGISNQMDRTAENLHSVDEQIAQLNTLVLRHSGSALAMALRKLNKSFLDKMKETEQLRQERTQLEQERDEALKQLEEMQKSPPNSNRASLIFRKSSMRRFRNMHPSSRRSSYSSHRMSNSSLHAVSAKSQFNFDGVPPVPPVPHYNHVPRNIESDLSMRSANTTIGTGLTSGITDPILLMEQEKLYVDIEQHMSSKLLRRSRSSVNLLNEFEFIVRRPTAFTTTTTTTDTAAADASTHIHTYRHRRNQSEMSQRPTSLPGDSQLSDAYKAMNEDSNAMLVTLRMLSDTT
ncbi:hypothetical protein AMATHDRAFT_3583 [Amanita thiersii Skay4041]|uniref:Uncharacterized protein n=1 Tax=Amanita thiersii Skay4041 TaxID=703135 RepID=A0A2A9NT12_9AGAR|nr:hypothetical protein AMATHDRAFT_3583 [Amanita thiersii Skay4041]